MITINSRTVHRLILSAVLVAHKCSQDICYNNQHFSGLTGVRLENINQMEIEFLYIIDYKLHVCEQELEAYAQAVDRFFKDENHQQIIEVTRQQDQYAVNYMKKTRSQE